MGISPLAGGESLFEKFWVNGNPTQYCGKDNNRFQSAMWQAMLMAADLPNSKQIIINGFITAGEGIKMSKTLGNVADPKEIVKEYGTDALRYFLLREVSSFEDSPFTMERFKDAYNANLANGLGNLVSRVMKMAETNLKKSVEIPENTIREDYKNAFEKFDLQEVTNIIWKEIGELDKKIQETKPFSLIKTDKIKAVEIIKELAVRLYTIGRMLNPILPETSEKIKNLVKINKMPEKPLFSRKD